MAAEINERGVVVTCSVCEARNRVPYEKLHRRGRCAHCDTLLPYVHRLLEVWRDDVLDALLKRSSVPVLIEFTREGKTTELDVVASCAQGDYVVAHLDTGRNPTCGARFDLRATPMTIVFVGGVDLGRLQHQLSASELERYVRSVIPPV